VSAQLEVNRGPRREFRLENPLTFEFRRICSLEHGTTDTKPSAETSTIPDTSAATKTTEACATTRTQLMGETSLKPLKAMLETIREQAELALKQLQKSEEERSMRWRCKDCKYTKHFTRPVPLEAAGRCPRCKSISFQCVA
jgi:predicted Zn-ribbon and HTH transcriptional regulator